MKKKAVERDIGTINIAAVVVVTVDAVGRASLEKGGADFVAAGEVRCGCLARAICVT